MYFAKPFYLFVLQRKESTVLKENYFLYKLKPKDIAEIGGDIKKVKVSTEGR